MVLVGEVMLDREPAKVRVTIFTYRNVYFQEEKVLPALFGGVLEVENQ